MTTLGIGIASLYHRRVRTLVGLVSVAVALAMLCLSLSATRRVRESLGGFDETSIMIISFRGESLPYALVNEIRSLVGDAGDVQWNAMVAVEDKTKQVSYDLVGASDDYFASYPASILAWSPSEKEGWLKDKQGIIVSQDLLSRMDWKVGSTVFLATRFGPLQAHIVGTSAGAISLTVFAHYEYLDQARPTHGFVGSVVVHRSLDPDALTKKIEDRFGTAEPPIVVMRERSFHEFIMSVSGALPELLEKVALVFGLCTLMLVFSNAIVSLKERRAEFGALRAIGFSRARVLVVIVGEFVALCITAGVLGCGLPYALFHTRGIHMGAMALENVTLEGPICLAVLATAIVLGSLVTLFPAIAVARASAVELLES